MYCEVSEQPYQRKGNVLCHFSHCIHSPQQYTACNKNYALHNGEENGSKRKWQVINIINCNSYNSVTGSPAAAGDLEADDNDEEQNCDKERDDDRQLRAVVKNSDVVIRTCIQAPATSPTQACQGYSHSLQSYQPKCTEFWANFRIFIVFTVAINSLNLMYIFIRQSGKANQHNRTNIQDNTSKCN